MDSSLIAQVDIDCPCRAIKFVFHDSVDDPRNPGNQVCGQLCLKEM